MFFKYLHINSILLLFFCLFIFSCQTSDEKRTKQFFQEWQNKQIIFTDNLTCSFLGKDTMCHELFSKKYKILLYVDSSDCTPCRLQLYEWHKKIEETKKYTDSLAYLFVVNTRNTPLIHILTKQQHFDYPIFIDKKRKMQRINNFPKEPIYQTFLLDKNNRVLLIGNPIGNIKLWKLYKDIIIE